MNQFKNGEMILNIISRHGRYALLERTGSYPEFVVAVDIQGETSGDWGQGRYFGNDFNSAKEVYNDYVSGNSTAHSDWCNRNNPELELNKND